MSKNSIEQQIQQLDKQKQPERDLWIGIERAIANDDLTQTSPHDAHPKRTFAIAASLLVVSLIGWLSFESGRSLQGNDLVAALSAQHSQQKQTLLIRYKDQPTATQNWQEQLDDLDVAAQAIKKALAEEPNNPALLKMLKQVYEQQMTLIERVHAPNWVRI